MWGCGRDVRGSGQGADLSIAPEERQLAVTTFQDFAASTKVESITTMGTLVQQIRSVSRAKKDALPWLKLARFGEKRTEKLSLRHDANVLEITGVEADYDGERVSVAEAAEILEKAGLLSILYTSPSHTEDTPRWRVLCPTSEAMPGNRREAMMGRLNGLFGGIFSGESWTLSQAYYYGSVNKNPSHTAQLIDGEPIDQHDDLDVIFIGKPATIPRAAVNGHHLPGVVDEPALLAEITTGASYHAASVRLLGRWARIGVAFMDARARIMAAFETIPESARDARWKTRYGDLDRCLEDIYGAEATQRDQGKRPSVFQEEPPEYFDDPGLFNAVDFSASVYEEPPPPPEPTVREVDPSRIFDPWNALQPVVFPLHVIPDTLQAFVESRSDTMGADPCALAWSSISACSAAIHGNMRLLMKRRDSWSVPPPIWVALVGIPSTLKSPIITTTWHPLIQTQDGELARWAEEHARWAAMPKKKREEVPEPYPKRRLITHDATMEKLQEILSRQSRGIGVVRDELSGWIGSMEKYAPGKGGSADRAFWLQSYNGGSHVVDRVMRGTLPIGNLLTTVCGGIQPDKLRSLGDITDDGLWQRFIAVIVAPATLGQDRSPGIAEENYNQMVLSLLTFDGSRTIRLSDQAHEIREDIQRHIHRLEQAEVLGTRFVGFVGKMAGLWGRLAMVFHLTGADPNGEVSEATARAARTVLLKSILPNAGRVYMAMGAAGGDIEATQSIAGYILTRRLDRIRMSDLISNVRVCRHRGADDIRKLLSPLQAGGWLLPEKEYNPTAWGVSEYVHVKFTERAVRETHRRAMVSALIRGGEDDDGGE